MCPAPWRSSTESKSSSWGIVATVRNGTQEAGPRRGSARLPRLPRLGGTQIPAAPSTCVSSRGAVGWCFVRDMVASTLVSKHLADRACQAQSVCRDYGQVPPPFIHFSYILFPCSVLCWHALPFSILVDTIQTTWNHVELLGFSWMCPTPSTWNEVVVWDRGSRIENRESRIEKREARIEDRGSRIENWESRMENWESRIGNREARIEDRESRMGLVGSGKLMRMADRFRTEWKFQCSNTSCCFQMILHLSFEN